MKVIRKFPTMAELLKEGQKKAGKAPVWYKEYSVVIVKWQDASYVHADCHSSEIDGYLELVTAGHLVRYDEKSISIGLDYGPEDGSWRHVCNIPTQMILDIKILNEGQRP